MVAAVPDKQNQNAFKKTEQLKTVTLSLVLTKLDQNNSLLYNLPDYLLLKLQRVQNSEQSCVFC